MTEPTDEDLIAGENFKKSLGLMLEGSAYYHRGKTALVSGNTGLSYALLDKASNKVAHALIELGVNKGDRIAMLLSNSPEFAISFFGIVKSGAIAVPLDPAYKLDELTALLNDCLPVMLITERPCLEPLIPSLPGFPSIKSIIDLNAPENGQFLSYQHIMETSSARKVQKDVSPNDIALILYTSGPSLLPHGVMLSHGGLIKEIDVIGDAFRQTETDVVMQYALPMYHVFGLVAVLLTAVSRGSTVVMVPGTGLSINTCMASIEREGGTMFFAVPYIFALAVELAEKEGIKSNLSSLRLCSSSADFLPPKLVQRFKELFGFNILDCFALTEAVCHVTCPSLDGTGKVGSVGKTLPGWKAKIVDDNDRAVPADRTGEIILKGPFMSGYYSNPQATAETLRGGWLHTGDIGKMDKDGNLFVTGRKKDIIIVKGQNIHPADIETVLYQHPDISEAAVIGIPDDMRGEVVGAVVSLKAGSLTTEQDIKRLCLERLASYKVPKQIIISKSLPRTSSGSIDKESIRHTLSIPSPACRVSFP